MKSIVNNFFYTFKPIIPRHLQLCIRRYIARNILKRSHDSWPINEKASAKPHNFTQWPDNKKFAFVLMHDVDTAIGHEKCLQVMELEQQEGFHSCFYFVPERYKIDKTKFEILKSNKFGIGVHGLKHDGKLFLNREQFLFQAAKINQYFKEWDVKGFSTPSMLCNREWMHDLNMSFATSSFDTDPFEPQPNGVTTIFPFNTSNADNTRRFIELPYTLVQDFTLFVILKEKTIDIWKKKLDWIVRNNGMVLLNSHPDYMNFNEHKSTIQEYPVSLFKSFLQYVKTKYSGQYWHALPEEIANFWKNSVLKN